MNKIHEWLDKRFTLEEAIFYCISVLGVAGVIDYFVPNFYFVLGACFLILAVYGYYRDKKKSARNNPNTKEKKE